MRSVFYTEKLDHQQNSKFSHYIWFWNIFALSFSATDNDIRFKVIWGIWILNGIFY